VGDAFNCNSTGGSTIDAGQTDLANLAVGDEFTTSDYTIVVTEASKTGTTFSGKGKLIFNFLKISNTLALQIPISVTFTGIKINQCYQLYSGKVVTEYDPSWGSVVSAEGIFGSAKASLQSISDLLKGYHNSDKPKLQTLSEDLNSQKTEILNDPNLSTEQKNQIIAAIDAANSSITCFINSSGLRISTTCSLEDLDTQINNSLINVEAADDPDCPCIKPTTIGLEGDKMVGTGIIQIYGSNGAPIQIPCKKTWIYHTSYTGAKYPTGWYHSSEYKKIETFVKDKIGPLIFVHGTFANPETFSEDFKKNVFKYTKTGLTSKDAISNYQWAGGNNDGDREAAAITMAITLNSNISKRILQKLNFSKHVILVCHSHGGNVAKRVKNILEGFDPAWVVDVINIETPQRSNFQFNNSSGKILNFWSNIDFWQWAGTIADFDSSMPDPGPLGSRKDPKADINLQLLSLPKIGIESYGGEMLRWINTTMGHSLHNDDWAKAQILFHINNFF
jgi:hypothetical protein